ncbi:hypothetical protein Tco_0513163, partial [Tanacetum coccineum]
ELALEQTQQGVSYEVSVSIKGVKNEKKVKIKGEKKEALLTLRQKLGQYICYQTVKNTKLLSGIEDNRHGPSDAMHNPFQPLKVSQKTLVTFLIEIKHISIDFLTPS